MHWRRFSGRRTSHRTCRCASRPPRRGPRRRPAQRRATVRPRHHRRTSSAAFKPTPTPPKPVEPPTHTVRRHTPPPSANTQTSAPSSIQRAESQALPLRVQRQSAETVEATPAETIDLVGVLPTSTRSSSAPTAPVIQRAVARRSEQPASETGGITIQRQTDPRVMARMEAGPRRAYQTCKCRWCTVKPQRRQQPSAEALPKRRVRPATCPGGRAAANVRFSESSSRRRKCVKPHQPTLARACSVRVREATCRCGAATTAASRSDATPARKNITIESPVFQAQQATIQRKWKSGKKALTAAKKFGAKIGKRGKQFFWGASSDKEKDAEQTTRSGRTEPGRVSRADHANRQAHAGHRTRAPLWPDAKLLIVLFLK